MNSKLNLKIIKKFKNIIKNKYLILFLFLIALFFTSKVISNSLIVKRENFEQSKLERVLYCFWTGNNEMSERRKKCFDTMTNSKVKVVLITPKNLDKYILKEHPLHPSYQYLSETHKADFLRTYFMRFHGGGYSDIKEINDDWNEAFNQLENSNKLINGYKEVSGGLAYGRDDKKWEKEAVGVCAFICKPNTKLTNEWYNEMITLLDSKLDDLKKNPAQRPDDSKSDESKYPIEWNEMLGRIFHRVCFKYRSDLLNTLPPPKFTEYR